MLEQEELPASSRCECDWGAPRSFPRPPAFPLPGTVVCMCRVAYTECCVLGRLSATCKCQLLAGVNLGHHVTWSIFTVTCWGYCYYYWGIIDLTFQMRKKRCIKIHLKPGALLEMLVSSTSDSFHSAAPCIQIRFDAALRLKREAPAWCSCLASWLLLLGFGPEDTWVEAWHCGFLAVCLGQINLPRP